MDQTPYSQTRAVETAMILKWFPAGEAQEVAQLLGKPAQLTAYLARTNDLTQSETREVLSVLHSALLPEACEGTLRAA